MEDQTTSSGASRGGRASWREPGEELCEDKGVGCVGGAYGEGCGGQLVSIYILECLGPVYEM